MTAVSMEKIKELRRKTHVGLMDCRKALEQSEGDIEKAIEILRKKGAAVAAKRSSQATNEGVVASFISDDHRAGALAEVACETDFSANTDTLRNFSKAVAEKAATNPPAEQTVDALLTLPSVDREGLTIEQALDEIRAKIAENIKVSRFISYKAGENGFIQSYIHAGSHLGAMIELTVSGGTVDQAMLTQLGKDLCMQIAVTDPVALDPSKVDPALIEKERGIFREQLAAAGKPANMIDKIIEGKLRKFYGDVCLLNQKFIRDDKITVQKHIEQEAKKAGVTIAVARFSRFAIGA